MSNGFKPQHVGFVEPPGPKITYTLEIWPEGPQAGVRATVDPETADPFTVASFLVVVLQSILEQMRQAERMIVGRGPAGGKTS